MLELELVTSVDGAELEAVGDEVVDAVVDGKDGRGGRVVRVVAVVGVVVRAICEGSDDGASVGLLNEDDDDDVAMAVGVVVMVVD